MLAAGPANPWDGIVKLARCGAARIGRCGDCGKIQGVDLAAERIWVFSLILSGSGCGAQGAVAFAAEFGFDIERVGAVKVDVVVLRRGPSAAGP
jgi:hypothetical protein